MYDARKLCRLVAASALALTVFSSAVQAACTQNRAVYRDRDGAYTLTFQPVQANALNMSPAPSNEFTITADDKPEFRLSGMVIWPEEEIARPYALITYNCKNGASEPEAFDECSIWQNVVYALKENAEADVLPKADEPAAQAILFPDLVTALDSYDFGAAKPETPLQWEAFRFQSCSPEQE
ncbi:hypothetical protein DKP76_03530 [Falsochrobactrum shanghaiense]|uniref:Uncharacterized protein n=1 Tax=Falsochrobactrum shanghaiense TaxID=2201899 RepID=A0A316JK12_9HYPH|nr:hypothetical protein [Falsochrobactrum shanghaiense]PWL19623.1 hypothetical protein DKP76_03530 [Falsochrobactrum shanghaiense]